MDMAALIVSFALLSVTGAAAVAAVVQARTAVAAKDAAEDARNESRLARDEAVRLSQEANAAFVRQATAQERSNEIEEAKLPRPHVDWQPRPGRGRDSRLLVNIGNIEARNVVGVGGKGVFTDEDSVGESVMPGDSIEYGVMPPMAGGGRPRLHVEWDDATTTQRRVWERAVQ